MNLQGASELLGIPVVQLIRQGRDHDMLPALISLAYNKGLQEASAHTHKYYHEIVEPRERELTKVRR